jgi:hypothetical protein
MAKPSFHRSGDAISKTRKCLRENKNLLGVTFSALSSLPSDVVCRRSTQTEIDSLYLSERRWSAALLNQSAYTERPIPPLVEVETPLPSRELGGGGIQRNRREREHIYIV